MFVGGFMDVIKKGNELPNWASRLREVRCNIDIAEVNSRAARCQIYSTLADGLAHVEAQDVAPERHRSINVSGAEHSTYRRGDLRLREARVDRGQVID